MNRRIRFLIAAASFIVLGSVTPLPGQSQNGTELTANEKALKIFFKKSLPPGWRFTGNEKRVTIERIAPVYLTEISPLDLRILNNADLLARARREGKKVTCSLHFRVERHDDVALVRQKIRLFQETRARVKALKPEPKEENLAQKKILTEKLELAPFYRIGTLYLYPEKDQCIPRKLDWYFTSKLLTDTMTIIPFEAREEIEIIHENLRALEFWL